MMLDTGLFDDLFERYEDCGPHYKIFGTKYFSIILVSLVMQVGANISPDQVS
jgi:hypothetical protein